MPAKITVRFDVEHPLFFISNTFILLRWLNFVFRRINRLCDRKKSEKKMKKKIWKQMICAIYDIFWNFPLIFELSETLINFECKMKWKNTSY